MADRFPTVTRTGGLDSILETNSVIRNTYILLGASLAFSGLTAYIAMVTNAKPLGLITLAIYFGLCH